jgi:MarR family transcriptional regulator, organic hydroperoxide resistance regulator
MKYEQLKLSNQVCFPVYAASRLIIREYQPWLDKMGITYPQYLVLMVLWETDNISVNEISEKLILKTNTITPLLKRMASLGIVSRKRSESDERKVIIQLTKKGKHMKDKAARVPEKLAKGLIASGINEEDLIELRNILNQFVYSLREKNKSE